MWQALFFLFVLFIEIGAGLLACMEAPHSIDGPLDETDTAYWQYISFVERDPEACQNIHDHRSFQAFLRSFNPLEVDVEKHLYHLVWLQRCLRGGKDWNASHVGDIKHVWKHFSEVGVLAEPDEDFPFDMVWQSLIHMKTFKEMDEVRYAIPLQKAAKRCPSTHSVSETLRFLGDYIAKVYKQGQECRRRWVVVYPGYISGMFYHEGYVLEKDEVQELMEARTYQFDARQSMLRLLESHHVDPHTVNTANVRYVLSENGGYNLRLQVNDIINFQGDEDVLRDIRGICLRYPDFELVQDVAFLNEVWIPTGYVHPMCHVQHSQSSIRWRAVSCAIDWLFAQKVDDPLPFARPSLLESRHKLACMLMIYKERVVS